MTDKLTSLREMSVVVADTGDLEAMRRLNPQDCTTNPSIVLKALQSADFAEEWDRIAGNSSGVETAIDDLTIAVGAALTKLVPGRVSTEVDAQLSFDTAASVAKAEVLIEKYEGIGIPRDRILIKLAATWEGIRAAAELQAKGIDCNLTLIFSLAQAAAAADAGAFLISPFVGRITDWYSKAQGKTFSPEEDPGVLSVRRIYDYYKSNDIQTVVMGASFRNTGQIEALAGCDRLTISPNLLIELGSQPGPLTRKLESTGEAVARLNLNENDFRWAMNEDPMATEKLAEGIRNFHADTEKLRALVAAKK